MLTLEDEELFPSSLDLNFTAPPIFFLRMRLVWIFFLRMRHVFVWYYFLRMRLRLLLLNNSPTIDQAKHFPISATPATAHSHTQLFLQQRQDG